MTIKVKLFASLADSFGWRERSVEFRDGITPSVLWHDFASEPPSEGILIAVNMDYGEPDTALADGDEVAFFPPITGGV